MNIYSAVNPHRRCVDVAVNPHWDWSRVFRSASSGLLGEHEDALRDSARDALRVDGAVDGLASATGHLAAYECDITLVSFGKQPVRHSQVMLWGIQNGFRPATLRETMAIPPSRPKWHEMFPDWDDDERIEFTRIEPSQVYDSYLNNRGAFWVSSALAIICLEAHAIDGHKKIFGIDFIDHGDFNLINYWATASIVSESDPTYLNDNNDCYPYVPEGRIWFAFVSKSTDENINESHKKRSLHMNYLKTIVCFANSRKTSGRCVAGKELRDLGAGEWVRPVSARPSHEVSEEERRYEDGGDPQLLDIIKVPCDHHDPASHQDENHVINPNYYWTKLGRLAWGDIQVWLDHPPNLWGTGEGSYAGLNNRLAVGQEDGTSLYLVAVERMQLIVGPKAPQYSAKRSVQGQFVYSGTTYRLDVTDPIIERNYLGQADGHYEIIRPALCVSLGDPHQAVGAAQSYFYKLIAAVLFKERFS